MSNETPDKPIGDAEQAQPEGAAAQQPGAAPQSPSEGVPARGAEQAGRQVPATEAETQRLGDVGYGAHPSEAHTEQLAQQAPTQRFDRFGPPQAEASRPPEATRPLPQPPQASPLHGAPADSASPTAQAPHTSGLFASPAGAAPQVAAAAQPAPFAGQPGVQPRLEPPAPLHAAQPGYPQRTPAAAHRTPQEGTPGGGQNFGPRPGPAAPFTAQPAQGHPGQPAQGIPGQPQASIPPAHAVNQVPEPYPGHNQNGGWQPPQAATAAPVKRKRERARTPWLALVVVALVAALAASAGTGFIMRGNGTAAAISPTSSPTATQLGTSSDDSVDVPVTSSSSENPNWQEVAAAVAPSVVSIQIQTSSGAGEGSGVIVDAEGLVLTNDHVVGDATKVSVTLQDGRIYSASIVGTDPTTDLAVVKLDGAPDDLKSAVFADSDAVKVGDAVMAVGNPLGLSNTATTGIVSALNRPVTTSGNTTTQSETVVTNAIQIDAAINPGNSGGPLFNAQGEVIGITSSIATMSDSASTSGSIGLGFAIPSNVADMIGGQLIENGVAEHAFLGVGLLDGQATADGVTRQGAQVQQVVTGSPAEKAGLKAGDVIVAIDGQAVSGAESLTAFVRAEASGTEVTLTIVRDGKTLSTEVALETRVDDTTTQGDQSGQDQDGQQDQQQAPDQQLPQFPQLPGDSDDN